MEINEYFARHPEMMLGRMGMESGQYGMAPALIGNLEPGALERPFHSFPPPCTRPGTAMAQLSRVRADQVPAVGEVKEGGLAERDGQIVVRRGDAFEPLTLPASVRARIRGMLQVRDAVREVFRTQLSDAPDEAIVEARRHLNRTYDFFASRFGPLNARENVKAFADDPDHRFCCRSKNSTPRQSGRPKPRSSIAARWSAIARWSGSKPRPRRCSYRSTRLARSVGRAWNRLPGVAASELQDELGSLAYRNPEGGAWETADRYLSGNVRAKLAVAQASEQIDPAYRRNVEALQAVQPKDLEPGEIEARLGSSWIPPSDIRDFVAELLDVPRAGVKIGYAETIATWTVELDYGAKYVVNNTTTHGTARFRASDLVEQSLNGRTPTAYDEDADGNRTVNQPETIAAREKQQQLKDRFRDWVWEDRERAAAAGARIQFPLQQHSAPRFRRFASNLARNGAHLPPRRRSRAASEERSLAHPPGR